MKKLITQYVKIMIILILYVKINVKTDTKIDTKEIDHFEIEEIQNKNKNQKFNEHESQRIILINKKIIEEVIDDMYRYTTVKEYLRKYVEIYTYMINQNIGMSEFTDSCRKLKKKPNTKCQMKIHYIGKTIFAGEAIYVYYQSVRSKCKNEIIKSKIRSNDLYELLSNEEKYIILNNEHSKIRESFLTPIILFPKWANIDIIDTVLPCKGLNCKYGSNMETTLILIDINLYEIYANICEKVYDKLQTTNDTFTYRVINEIINIKNNTKNKTKKIIEEEIKSLDEIDEIEYTVDYSYYKRLITSNKKIFYIKKQK